MKTPAEIRRGNRERAAKHRAKVREKKLFDGLSHVRTLAEGAEHMNRTNRMAYCPKNGEPCNPEECCRLRRERTLADTEI